MRLISIIYYVQGIYFISTHHFWTFSNVAYHGDLQKKAAMEQKRTLANENGEGGGGGGMGGGGGGIGGGGKYT